MVCPFDATLAVGKFSSSSGGFWEDGDITIEADSEDPYKVYVSGLPELEGAVSNGVLEMNINPLSFVVSVVKGIVAEDFYGYDDLSFAGYGLFDSCNGVYTLNLTATVVQGSFGTGSFVFTKK